MVVLEARDKIGGRSERRHVTTAAGAEVPCNLPQCTKPDGSVNSKWWWDLGGESSMVHWVYSLGVSIGQHGGCRQAWLAAGWLTAGGWRG